MWVDKICVAQAHVCGIRTHCLWNLWALQTVKASVSYSIANHYTRLTLSMLLFGILMTLRADTTAQAHVRATLAAVLWSWLNAAAIQELPITAYGSWSSNAVCSLWFPSMGVYWVLITIAVGTLVGFNRACGWPHVGTICMAFSAIALCPSC